ncbi:MAG: GNAT family N-acetyltransferase [Pseudobutyrivibrio sp.]|nr:GNAT family N-acetyltransferase [Pseudobutyrivibrio sp.]
MQQRKNDFYLRQANSEDMMLLFDWVNEKTVRENSFSTDMISIDKHKEWFQKSLQNKDRFIYILMKDDLPLGQIRFDVSDEEAEIDYSIDKAYRNKGIGNIIISLGIERITKDCNRVKTIVAKVKGTNAYSQKCFIRNGFEEYGKISDSDYEIVEYRKS